MSEQEATRRLSGMNCEKHEKGLAVSYCHYHIFDAHLSPFLHIMQTARKRSDYNLLALKKILFYHDLTPSGLAPLIPELGIGKVTLLLSR